MLNFKSIIIGAVVGIILYFILILLGLGFIGGVFGFFIAGITASYQTNENFKNAAIHGLLTGLIGYLTIMLILVVIIIITDGQDVFLLIENSLMFIIGILSFASVSTIGGIAGIWIKNKI
ncbi:DUF5518 domain-containing protein [Methanobacterium sp.]|uniref:DUF5518 domain-containing protein n=1 Tax=Methanobacterium sp. TaxID=2164 RepID=UPI003D64F859